MPSQTEMQQLIERLRKIQQQIQKNPDDDNLAEILLIWEFGNEIRTERVRNGLLSNETSDIISMECGIPRHELKKRAQFPQKFKKDEVSRLVARYRTWSKIKQQAFPTKPIRNLDITPVDARAAEKLDVERRERRAQLSGIRDRNAENLYMAMRNAPPGAISIPMMNRATKVFELLHELAVLDPSTAASQVHAVRCREYSGCDDLVEWLHKFVECCEKRRASETPKLGHLHRPVDPDMRLAAKPAGEHSPIERAVLDVLLFDGSITEAELGVSISTSNIYTALSNLEDKGLIEVNDGIWNLRTAEGEEVESA